MQHWGCAGLSEPTLRRASSVDQYLFVNGRPVKDKVLVGALRAAYMDVMHAREFPLCALYLTLDARSVDVNVSPAKTEVHFLEPAHVRGFIIKTLRDALARTMMAETPRAADDAASVVAPRPTAQHFEIPFAAPMVGAVHSPKMRPSFNIFGGGAISASPAPRRNLARTHRIWSRPQQQFRKHPRPTMRHCIRWAM